MNPERELLQELVLLVRGECPSLLDEDSGGDARLSIAIDELLAQPEQAPTGEQALQALADQAQSWGEYAAPRVPLTDRISISKAELFQVFRKWEELEREGVCATPEEVAEMTIDERAQESADYLWQELALLSGRTGLGSDMSESDRMTIARYISEAEKDPTFATALAVARLQVQVAELRAALRELVEALDYATISSWQSTTKWDKQLAAARALIEKETK